MLAGRLRSTAIVTGLLVVTLLTVSADVTPPPAKAAPNPPAHLPLTIVSLGDSTISGEGAGYYTTDTNGRSGDWCHRSAKAEINETHLPGVTQAVNFACSGANSPQVNLGTTVHYTEHSQAAQLAALAVHARINAIVVGVG